MNDTASPDKPSQAFLQNEDVAWAAINTPLFPEELHTFCRQDIERLFRINPYLEFNRWEAIGDNRYSFSGKNASRTPAFAFDLRLKVEEVQNGLTVHYDNGIKERTVFQIEPSDTGSKLTIHEFYRQVEQDDDALEEVDRSLTTWAGDLQKYLVMWKKWRWIPPWRWYMNHVWNGMKPTGRRIAYMFWWITLVEIALIFLGIGIYFAELS